MENGTRDFTVLSTLPQKQSSAVGQLIINIAASQDQVNITIILMSDTFLRSITSLD